ncbi:hypothetical protein [Halobacterium salinarum]|uniref:hypothetical protein n=1 Tax=Halobacterium salinarum TaxID=2242 RepID=UPI0025549F4A|nr:hypothetical protein [Halobacterium salinarum]MDL0134751.1 hypothetical protein [Halobacterium salinarum]
MTREKRLALAEPLADTDVPVAEAVATTRRAEARTAMALVRGLRDAGVPTRDIVVVARDLDDYEQVLHRAALQYALTPVFWTQLRATRTTPFALIEEVCDILGAEEVGPAALCRPLELRWCPPTASETAWPLRQQTIQTTRNVLPSGKRTLSNWQDIVHTKNDLDERIGTYIEWLTDRSSEPAPATVRTVVGDVVEAYEQYGLPATKDRDDPALLETERDARAVVRMRELVRQLPHKYEERLEEGTAEQTWHDVVELARLIVTQRPGRREHSNARAIDVLEANDIWMLDVPYVIAVGLVDGEWPTETASVLPPELQEAILTGDDAARPLAPSASWTAGRDRDQFDDTLRAARSGLIFTRYTESADGEERRPSPLLEYVDPDIISEEARQHLVSSTCELPSEIREMLSGREVMANE